MVVPIEEVKPNPSPNPSPNPNPNPNPDHPNPNRKSPNSLTCIGQVYMSRARSIRFALDSCVRKRQSDLFTQVRRVEGRMTEVRQAKQTIERSTMQDAQAIVDRLTCDEALNKAPLKVDSHPLMQSIFSNAYPDDWRFRGLRP